MNRPVLYTDFDGVLNAFPDKEIQDNGGVGHTQWLDDNDPRAQLYSTERAFVLTGDDIVRTPCGYYRIRWSRNIAQTLHRLASEGNIELNWLTTWQPYCSRILDPLLGWDPHIEHTAIWYNPISYERRYTGKLSTVFSRVRFEATQADPSPVIWLDDEECYETAADRIRALSPKAPVLMVRPDARIGISRRQWRIIQKFIRKPETFPELTLDEEPTIREYPGHLGF